MLFHYRKLFFYIIILLHYKTVYLIHYWLKLLPYLNLLHYRYHDYLEILQFIT